MFFQEGRKFGRNCEKIHPFFLSFRLQTMRDLRTKTLCILCFNAIGGGSYFQEHVWSLVSPLVEKNTGTFVNTKRVSMADFSGFWAIRKIATKLGTYASLPQSPSIKLYKIISLLDWALIATDHEEIWTHPKMATIQNLPKQYNYSSG